MYRRRYSKAPARSYRRRSYRRKYRRSRRRFRSAASNLRRGGRLGIETKYVDGGVQAGNVFAVTDGATLANVATRQDVGGSGTTAVGNLWIIPQGDGPSNRDGAKLTVLKVVVRGFVFFPHSFNTTVNATSLLDVPVHIFIVLDTQSNGASCLLNDVFTFPTTNGATEMTSAATLSDTPAMFQRNMTWGRRFAVLKHMVLRRRYALSDITDTSLSVDSSPAAAAPFKWMKKMRMNVTYAPSNTDGQMAGIQDNSIHVFAVMGNTNGSTPDDFDHPTEGALSAIEVLDDDDDAAPYLAGLNHSDGFR